MKKTLIGAGSAIIGAISVLFLHVFIANNMTSSWTDPPGRFFTTMEEIGMTFPYFLFLGLFILGVIILSIEYFRK